MTLLGLAPNLIIKECVEKKIHQLSMIMNSTVPQG